MPFTPYLSFPGNAEDVLDFYRDALGGEAEIVRFAGSPAAEHMPPDWGSKLLHAKLDTPNGTICLMDADPARAGKAGGGNVLISIELPDAAGAEPVFAKLAAGGQVTMPLGPQFWSPMFGMLIDKFGTTWMINGA